jgi:DNA-binding NarL/FixJ family response regulator
VSTARTLPSWTYICRGMNGLGAMSPIRSEFCEARIIVLTTYADDIQVVRAMQAGVRAYLLKNQLYKELLETIRAVHAAEQKLLPTRIDR